MSDNQTYTLQELEAAKERMCAATWQTVQDIERMPAETRHKLFGFSELKDILETIPANIAAQTVFSYKERVKDICPGDEIVWGDKKAVCTGIDDSHADSVLFYLCPDGSCGVTYGGYKSGWQKTGRRHTKFAERLNELTTNFNVCVDLTTNEGI